MVSFRRFDRLSFVAWLVAMTAVVAAVEIGDSFARFGFLRPGEFVGDRAGKTFLIAFLALTATAAAATATAATAWATFAIGGLFVTCFARLVISLVVVAFGFVADGFAGGLDGAVSHHMGIADLDIAGFTVLAFAGLT